MAAGQHNTSTKRYSSKEETTHPLKTGHHLKTLSSGCDHGNTQRTLSSGGRSRDHTRRNVYVRGVSYGMSEHSSDSELEGKSREAIDYEDSSRVGCEKKRKFAPVMWDRNEQAKVYSKNRILHTSSAVSQNFPPKSYKASGQLIDIVVDVRIAGCPVVDGELPISPAESLVSDVSDGVGVPNSLTPVTMAEQHTDERDMEKLEEGEYVEERNLSKSKWAFEDSPGIGSDANNSSLESGNFKREPFEGRDESSLSSEAGHFIAPASGDAQSENDAHDEGVMGNVYDKVASSGMGYFSSGDDCDDHHMIQAAEVPMHECRNVYVYERLNKISEGTYGVVYKARDKKTGDIVALKKVKLGKEREGFPVTALREINILRSFHHPSIVEVKEVVMDDFDGVYMVMDYIDHELKGYMESMKQPFSQSEIKCLMIQLLEGLSYLHDNWVIHRDLKTSNLLLNNKGELKICDFGMSRQYGSPLKPFTSLVVTLWYRAPEVLLGMKQYSTAIDMWSVGCIMAELLAKKPLFDGNRELEQIDKIFRTLGTPNDSVWPGYTKLPGVKPNFVKQPYNNLRKRFPVATFTGSPVLTELGFDLLNKLLTYDPMKRITAEEALNHGWFREAPLPAQHLELICLGLVKGCKALTQS